MKNADPLVSIIIPVFNRFDLAFRAINSVLSQTHTNWELFIIDDCSESVFELGEYIVKQIDARPIKVFRNETNLGPGRSRQKGLNNASGEYVCFLDSDDYYHNEFLTKSIDTHKINPDIFATYTTAIYLDSQKVRHRSDISFDEIVPTILTGSRPWPTCGLLWKNQGLPEWRNLRTNQDYWFELDCAMINNKIKHIPETLVFVDKNTSYNTNDLVAENQRLINRNIIFQYALINHNKFVNVNSSSTNIRNAAIKRLLYSTGKIIKYGNSYIIWENTILILRHNFLLGCVSLFALFTSFIPQSRFLGDWIINRSLKLFSYEQ